MINKFMSYSNSYTIFRNDRNRYEGGVIIGTKRGIKSIEIQTKTIETITIKMFNKSHKCIISSVYITSNITSKEMTQFNDVMHKLCEYSKDYQILICGDFDINFLDNSKNSVEDFKNIINQFGIQTKSQDINLSLLFLH